MADSKEFWGLYLIDSRSHRFCQLQERVPGVDSSLSATAVHSIKTVFLMNTHKELVVWQKSISLARAVYRATQEFPIQERYGLSIQLRRAGVSIASNIAEGSARGSRKEFLHYLHISRGSLAELETQIIIAQSLGFLACNTPLSHDVAEVGRLIGGLISSLRRPRLPRRATAPNS